MLNQFREKKIKLMMFDLDGTLVDSVPDLAWAVDAMLADLNEARAGIDQVRLWVGNGAQMLVKRALSHSMEPAELDPTKFQVAMDLFYNHYSEVNGSKSELYPGVKETLNILRKRIPYLALVTNKPEQFTQPLLDRHQLPKFDLLVCGDTLPERKPHPAQLLYCMHSLGCKAEESLMVGDSLSDIKAAQAAGVRMICVSYGYHQGLDLSAYFPDLMIDEFEELLGG